MATYELTDRGNVVQRHTLDTGKELVIAASDIRRERTGIHARIQILLNLKLLGHDNFNIERDADRVRLANSAHKQLSEADAAVWPSPFMKRALDDFAIDLWDYWLDVSSTRVELEYDAAPAPTPLLLDPYLVEGGGTILFGPPERGKSWSALLMACCAHAGLSWPWRTSEATPTLFVNLERPAASLYRRIGCVRDALELPESFRLPLYNARGKPLADIADPLRRTIKQEGYRLLVLDSLSRAGVGDLTENQPANRIADLLNSFGVTWLAIGHTPRGDDTHLYGSVFFDAAADVMVNVTSERDLEGSLGLVYNVTKANDMATPKPESWVYEFGERGLSAVRRAKAGEFGDIQPPHVRLREFLGGYGKATIKETATALDLSYGRAAKLLQDSHKAGIIGYERRASTGGRPEHVYFLLAPDAETFSSDEKVKNTYENPKREKEDGLIHKSFFSRGEEKERTSSESAFEPCATCGARVEPDGYTPSGLPLCAGCWSDR